MEVYHWSQNVSTFEEYLALEQLKDNQTMEMNCQIPIPLCFQQQLSSNDKMTEISFLSPDSFNHKEINTCPPKLIQNERRDIKLKESESEKKDNDLGQELMDEIESQLNLLRTFRGEIDALLETEIKELKELNGTCLSQVEGCK